MQYAFANEDRDYSDLASGFVIFSLPGRPAFPVRVASELFLRAVQDIGGPPVSVLDPCCGAAYGLTTLGLLHPGMIARIGAGDIDLEAVHLARANLDLLSTDGLARRKAQIAADVRTYGRPIHTQALAAVERLAESRRGVTEPEVRVAQADATNPLSIRAAFGGDAYDLLFTDLPYGESTEWGGANKGDEPASSLKALARACRPFVRPRGLMIVVKRRGAPVELKGFDRMRRLRCRGRRDAFFYRRTK